MGGAFSSSNSSSSSGKKKPPPAAISQVDRAVLDLKNARDRLSKYKKKLEQDEGKIVLKAKEAKQKGQTKTALNLLRLRKIKTREVQSVEGQLLTIFQMVQTIDSKQNESQVLEAMAKGKDALKKMHEETTVDHVLELMDQISEQNEVEREISGILEGQEHLSVEDEAAVEAELEALMMEQTTTTMTELPTVPVTKPLPTAPSTKLPEDTAEAEKRVAVPS